MKIKRKEKQNNERKNLNGSKVDMIFVMKAYYQLKQIQVKDEKLVFVNVSLICRQDVRFEKEWSNMIYCIYTKCNQNLRFHEIIDCFNPVV